MQRLTRHVPVIGMTNDCRLYFGFLLRCYPVKWYGKEEKPNLKANVPIAVV